MVPMMVPPMNAGEMPVPGRKPGAMTPQMVPPVGAIATSDVPEGAAAARNLTVPPAAPPQQRGMDAGTYGQAYAQKQYRPTSSKLGALAQGINNSRVGRKIFETKQADRDAAAATAAEQTAYDRSMDDREFGLKERQFEANSNKPLTELGRYKQAFLNGEISREDYDALRKNELKADGTRIRFDAETNTFSYEQGDLSDEVNIGLGSKAAKGKVEKSLVSDVELVSKLDTIMDSYSEDYLTFFGRGYGNLSEFMDKANLSTPDQKKFLAGRKKFQQGVDQIFNAYRKEITGAAAAVQELEALKTTMMNSELSPTQFEASYNQFRNALETSIAVRAELLRNGIDLNTKFGGKLFDEEYLERREAVQADGGGEDGDQPSGSPDVTAMSDAELKAIVDGE